MKENSLTYKIRDIAIRAGLFSREKLEIGTPRGSIRKEVPIAHGMRKFSTQLVEADLKTELRWLLEGHNLKGNDIVMLEQQKNDYNKNMKAIDNLTIDPANRLQRKVQTLTVEKTILDNIALRLNELEKKWE